MRKTYLFILAWAAACWLLSPSSADTTPPGPVQWNTLGTQVQIGAGATPGIAVDSLGGVHVVYMAAGSIWYRKAGPDLVFGTAEQIPSPDGSADYCCPSVKCDTNNVPHVAFQRGWAGDCHTNWYSNRIGGSWKAPVKVIDNDIKRLDGRANYPRLALHGSYAYVSTFGVPGELADGSEGTIVRITDLSGVPTVDRTAYSRLWVPHVLVATDGRLFAAGRRGPQGVHYQQYDLNLGVVGDMHLLTGGMEHRPGEENAECIDSANVIHVAGAVNLSHGTQTWLGHIFYNSSARADAGQQPLVGLEGTTSWDNIQVYPTVAADPANKVYIAWRGDPLGEGRITTVSGGAYATPVTYASNVTKCMRWNPQIAATPTGGVYAAWDAGGHAYVRGIGVGSYTPQR